MLARRGMVCSAVPIASAAGVAMFRQGGNAIDAALAAAAVLCVVEPMMTGLGGDAFALVASAAEGRVIGLNGSGRAPAAASAEAYRARGLSAIAPGGILSATVPGAVHAWQSLSQRFGALPLATTLEPAIRAAEDGFPVTESSRTRGTSPERIGALRNDAARTTWLAGGRAPRAGAWFRAPGLGRTLRQIADGGAAAFYEGEAAQAIVAASREEDGFFELADLARHTSTWVEPIATTYRGVEVLEIPPNGQGIAALQALGILECFEPASATSALDWHRRIEAVKIAFADRAAYIADPERADVPIAALLDKNYARRRAVLLGDRALAGVAPGLASDTTYLCAADEHGNLVSFIQSLFTAFGSGIGCGGHRHRAAESRRRFRARCRSPELPRTGQAPLPHHHPRHAAPRRRAVDGVRIDGRRRPAAIPPEFRRESRRPRTQSPGGDRPPALPLPGRAQGGDRGATASRRRGRHLGRRAHRARPRGDRTGRSASRTSSAAARPWRSRPASVLVGASDRRKDGCALGWWE